MKQRSLLAGLAALALAISCGKKEEQAPPMGPMPFPVETVTQQDAVIYQEFTANLEGQQNVEIRPKVNGFIQKIFVDEGQQVRKGQLLFKLETQSLSQDAAAAKANVAAAQVEVDRLKPLVERNIISNVQLETAKAKLLQAKAAYSSIAVNAGYGTITSPADGVIGSIPFKEGALVGSTTEMPLTTVSDSRRMRAYFTMNEKQLLDFSRTFKGSTLQDKLKSVPAVSLLLVDGSEYELKGRLATVNGLADPTTGTTQFRAEFDNPEAVLRSGSSGVVRIPVQMKGAILVPQNAVMDMQGKQMIYVVNKDNTVQSRIIQTQVASGTKFIVTEGLQQGDVIVTAGANKLKDGQQIVQQQGGQQAAAPQGAPAAQPAATTKK